MVFREVGTFGRIMSKVLTFLIRLYGGIVSPFTGRSCRFQPTCSAYAREAIEAHGAWKGSVLGVKRICKCHPFNKSPADDPVPD